jgi:hypothetical protein
MYKIKESGKGKKYCSQLGIHILNEELSQRVLKQLFKNNCEHIEYEQTTNEEASTQIESVPEKDTKNKSNGSGRRKTNNRKRSRKPKTD